MNRVLARGLITLVICILVNVPAVSSSAATQPSARNRNPASPNIVYSAGGHLWMRPVDGGAPRLIRTPWPMATQAEPYALQGVQWSPDGRRIAVDDGASRLAVIKLANGHVTILRGRRCAGSCLPPNDFWSYGWSPNGRYLAFLVPTGSAGPPPQPLSTLRVWDSSRGTTRTLLGGVYRFGYLSWSRNGTRLVVNTGRFDTRRGVFPSATVVDLNGHAYSLGTGSCFSFACLAVTGSAWSPDDRFIASVRSHVCGANTCIDDELVRRSSGGSAIVLVRNMDSNFEDVAWAPQANGYAFDRWLLNASGHITRRLAGPHERIDGWEPDGSHVAVQTYRPYEGTPDALYLSSPEGKRVHLYTLRPNTGCGACSKIRYSITWSHGGRLLAFTTPQYHTPKRGRGLLGVTVYPMVFLGGIDGGPLTRIRVPADETRLERESYFGRGIVDVMAFVDNDQELIIHSGRKIYRYFIATRRLTTIATGVIRGFGTPAIDPAVLN